MAEALGKRLGRGAHVSVFKNFGTAQVKYHGTEVEFVGARKESYQRDSRKPIVEDGIIKAETPSTEYTLSGYLDNQADDFPEIHQTWHGAEGDIYYLVSEKGFNRLPTKRKTFCMELNVEKKKEKNIMYEIQIQKYFRICH